MFWLGLFIAVASIPGYTSATIPAGWAAMSIVLPLTLWREARWSPLHSLFLAFLGYAILSFAWTSAQFDGVFRLWQFGLMFLAFRLGSSLTDLTEVLSGLAVGCAVSSALAIAQAFGWNPVLVYSPGNEAPGLFFNHGIAGQTLALVAIAALCFGLWWQTLALFPGIYLSGSRGAWIVLAVGFASIFIRRPKLLLVVIIVALFAVTSSASSHDHERVMIWKAALGLLSWPGQGIGSFNNLYLLFNGRLTFPEYVHNDPLQLVFEFGLGAIFLFALTFAILSRSARDEYPTLAAAFFLSFFAFPLFTPISAFLIALCAGRVAACRGWVWDPLPNRRYDVILWNGAARLFHRAKSRSAIPVQPRASQENA